MTATVERTGFSPARTLPNGQAFHSPYGAFPFQADAVATVLDRTAPDGVTGQVVVYDTGTGKTIIALASGAFLYEDGEIERMVVLAEPNVVEDWKDSVEEFTNLSAFVYHGSGREKRLEKYLAAHGMPHVFITTYETGARELVARESGKRGRRSFGPLVATLDLLVAPTFMVFDEIGKLKNRASNLWRDYDFLVSGMRRGPHHQRFIGLCATPLSTDYGNGYNIGRIVCSERMPSVADFERDAVAAVDDWGSPVYRKEYEPTFAKLFQGVAIRKRKTDPDVARYFPRQHELATHVDLSIPHREFYDVVSQLFDPPEGEPDTRNSREVVDDEARLWNLLRMSAGHPGAHIHARNPSSRAIVEELGEDILRGIGSSKVPVLLDELAPFREKGWPVVVFSFYQSVLLELGRELEAAGCSYVNYHGGLSKSAREKAKKTFTGGHTEVFLATDAASRGMNLQVSPAVIEYESALTFDRRTQRNNRVHRITSGWPEVWCRVLVLNETVEDGGLNLALKRNAAHDTMVGDEEDETAFIPAEMRRELLQASRRRKRAHGSGRPAAGPDVR